MADDDKPFEVLVKAIKDYILTSSPDHCGEEEADKIARERANLIDDML